MQEHKIEPIVLLLCGLVIFYTIVLVVIAKVMSSDGQTFQIIAGLVTGFSGALLMRVKPKTSGDDPPDTGSFKKTTLTEVETPTPKKEIITMGMPPGIPPSGGGNAPTQPPDKPEHPVHPEHPETPAEPEEK